MGMNVTCSLLERLFSVAASKGGGWRRWPDGWSDLSGALVTMSNQLIYPKGHIW